MTRPYPRYRDSGVEWLGEVPAHWEVTRLGFALTETVGGGTPDTGREEYWAEEQEDGLPWVAIADMSDGGSVLATEKRITASGLMHARLRPLAIGTVIYSMYASVGVVARLGISAVTNQAILGLLPGDTLTPAFLYWWLSAIRRQVLAFTRRNTQSNLNAETVRALPIALPPTGDQVAIATYLDRETERIDALVAKKRSLLERLAEYRTALITRTVTRGLDPSVAMKDSGVEWLGEVPAHWEVAAFSREVGIAEGQLDPELEAYSSMLLVAPNHVESRSGRILNFETAAEQGAISGKYFCRAGDVIYSKIRPALAKVVVAPEDCLCSADMYPLQPRGTLVSGYLFWLLLSDGFVAWSVLEADRVAMPKINRETLGGLRLPIPPRSEQLAIDAYLCHKAEQIHGIIGGVRAASERLQEYRTALITAAVTGKIDVRESAVHETRAAGGGAP